MFLICIIYIEYILEIYIINIDYKSYIPHMYIGPNPWKVLFISF